MPNNLVTFENSNFENIDLYPANEKHFENEFPRDVTFNISEFKQLQYYYDRLSIARSIQNIVITKPGTYPNNPDFGVGIENYLFELADPKVLSELTSNINSQIGKWITKDSTIEIKSNVKFFQNESKPNYITVVIYFSIIRGRTSVDNNLDNVLEDIFSLQITQNKRNRQLLSKLEL